MPTARRRRVARASPGSPPAAIVCALGALLLYSPPQHVTVITLFVGSLVLYLGWSTFEIPHNAWVTNLSPDYAGAHGHSRCARWRTTSVAW
jgi:Na+/melibiose symporter-like transporter